MLKIAVLVLFYENDFQENRKNLFSLTSPEWDKIQNPIKNYKKP